MVNTCERRGIGVEKFISVGNEAKVSAFDVLDYMRDDPDTECVMMYLEGIEDGTHFVEVPRRTTAVKPVVVLRGGLTEVGRQGRRLPHGGDGRVGRRVQGCRAAVGGRDCGTADELVDLGACLAVSSAAERTAGGGGDQRRGSRGPGGRRSGAQWSAIGRIAGIPGGTLDELLPPFWRSAIPSTWWPPALATWGCG